MTLDLGIRDLRIFLSSYTILEIFKSEKSLPIITIIGV